MCLCVCVLGLGTDSPANRDHLSPVCPHSLSLIGSKPRSQTTQGLTHRDSGWRSVAAGQEEEYSTIPSPDSKHFGSFVFRASVCQSPTHYTAYIHIPSHTGTDTVGSIHGFLRPFKPDVCVVFLSQWTHEYVLCWTD